MGSDSEEALYSVVVNDELQFSIWPVTRAQAIGWKEAGYRGSRAECLAHIKSVWTDMRPLSLRSSNWKSEAMHSPPSGADPAEI
jgi:MbtH protein